MRFSVSFRRAKQIATGRLKEGFLFISNHTLLFACPYPVCSFRSNRIYPCIASLDFITDNIAFQSVNHPVQANDDRAFVSDLMDSIHSMFLKRYFIRKIQAINDVGCAIIQLRWISMLFIALSDSLTTPSHIQSTKFILKQTVFVFYNCLNECITNAVLLNIYSETASLFIQYVHM